MGTLRPALAIHHAPHPLAGELAVLAVERTAMDAQGGTELVLLRQAQLHQLGRHDAPPYHIAFGVHEDGQARSEIGDLLVLAYHGHDGVNLLGVTRLGRQLVLCRHLESPHRDALIITHHQEEVKEILAPTGPCQES